MISSTAAASIKHMLLHCSLPKNKSLVSKVSSAWRGGVATILYSFRNTIGNSSPRQQFHPWVPDAQVASDLAKAKQVQCSGNRIYVIRNGSPNVCFRSPWASQLGEYLLLERNHSNHGAQPHSTKLLYERQA